MRHELVHHTLLDGLLAACQESDGCSVGKDTGAVESRHNKRVDGHTIRAGAFGQALKASGGTTVSDVDCPFFASCSLSTNITHSRAAKALGQCRDGVSSRRTCVVVGVTRVCARFIQNTHDESRRHLAAEKP